MEAAPAPRGALPVVVLAATDGKDSAITMWDAATGTQLAALKGNTGIANGLALAVPATGGPALALAAQAGRGALLAWTLGREPPSARSFPPEPARCVAVTPCGSLIAAGGASGAVWLWEGATGRLLRAWAAHFREAAALAFSPDATWLLTGGADGVAAVWDVAAVADAAGGAQPHGPPPTPRHAWTSHTLPVTAVAAGAGVTGPLAASASLDHSVRLWCASSGAALRVVTLPSPARSLALDAAEHAAYAGCEDGVAYELDLVGDGGDSGARSGLPAGVAAALAGHAATVTSLLAPPSSPPLIITGSADGTACVWDARSRTQLRVLKPAGPAPGALVALAAAPPGALPPGLRPGEAAAAPKPPVLARDRAEPWLGPPVLLRPTACAAGVAASGLLGDGEAAPPPAPAAATAAVTCGGSADLVAALAEARAEAARWRDAAARAAAAAVAGGGE